MRYITNFDSRELETIQTDFLVVGTGVAGLRAAIEASREGSVTVITKGDLKEGCTWFAQGGVAVAISKDDSPELHIKDTLNAGAGLCDEKAVRVLVEEGISCVQELLSWGARFDMINGRLAFTMEGAHQIRRIIHATGDATGEEIHRALLQHARKIKSIKFMERIFLADLLTEEGSCAGGIALDKDGNPFIISSLATILASGGLGQVYEYSTNPSVATGDGFAAAYRAGCSMQDMEFVQFHPTVLYIRGEEPFLISEAVRGEGGVLRDSGGEAFMRKEHRMADLAPRDIVSRAIFARMRRTRKPNVYLDLRHLRGGFLRTRFPKIFSRCSELGIDITSDLIPVRPAAHFAMGGARTGLDAATNVKRLFACGEGACAGVHGANRLASNSLLEGLVFGRRAGEAAAAFKESSRIPPGAKNKLEQKYFGEGEIAALKTGLKRVIESKVGITRCRDSLGECLEKLKIYDEMFSFSLYNLPSMEFRNMLTTGCLIAEAALAREESRGAHYRSDFPERDDKNWKKHIISQKYNCRGKAKEKT